MGPVSEEGRGYGTWGTAWPFLEQELFILRNKRRWR